MKYTPPLSNQVILPSKLLAKNVNAILSSVWPSDLDSPTHLGDTLDQTKGSPFDWVLFYAKRNPTFQYPYQFGIPPAHYEIRGYRESIDTTKDSIHQLEMFTIKTFSPVMKNLVQIAIWSHVSFWLVLAMLINTLVYNGFLTNDRTSDSGLCLVLVGAYAVANGLYQIFSIPLLYKSFTLAILQATWTIISSGFSILHYSMDSYRDALSAPERRGRVFTIFNSDLYGTTERADTFQHRSTLGANHDDYQDSAEPMPEPVPPVRFEMRDNTQRGESKLDKFLKPQREAELKAYEKATESGLDRTLANVVLLLGICLATALAPWTSIQATTTTSTSAQLGSYALLISVSTGIVGLLTSMTHLTTATESARKLLEYQELAITSHHLLHDTNDTEVNHDFSRLTREAMDSHEVGFFYFHNKFRGHGLTWVGYLRSSRLLGKVLWPLFGSALMLIPRLHQGSQRMDDSSMRLDFKIAGDEAYNHEFAYFPSGKRQRFFRSQGSGQLGLQLQTLN